MAETSVPPLLREPNTQQEEEEPDPQSLDPPCFQTVDSLTGIFSQNINDVEDDILLSDFCSACLDTLCSHISCASDSDSDSALESDSNLNCVHGGHEENDLMDLVMGDLCVSCREDEFSMSDGQISNSLAFEEEVEEERLGFGLDRSVVASGRGGSSAGGLRVAGIDSESDSELVNDEIIDDGSGEEQLGGTLFWDCIGFEEQMSNSGELDWEEIEERVVDEREGLRSVIDRIEEISVSSSLSRYDEINEMPEDADVTAAAESLEWEVLVEMVNWDRPRMHQFEAEDDDDDNDSYLAVQDDYTTDGGENITNFLHQFTRDSIILRGSPPTAESVRKNLPCVVLTEEELQKENLICAVCKDGIVVDEKVTMLPCNHHYHCECIVPWLNVRNTCPLCRYELPTDDMDYELRKNQEGGVGFGGDSEDGYNYEWLV